MNEDKYLIKSSLLKVLEQNNETGFQKQLFSLLEFSEVEQRVVRDFISKKYSGNIFNKIFK